MCGVIVLWNHRLVKWSSKRAVSGITFNLILREETEVNVPTFLKYGGYTVEILKYNNQLKKNSKSRKSY